MNNLSQERLLALWDRSLGLSPVYFGLDIIRESFPEINRERVMMLPLGKRDSLLMKIREKIFGSGFTNTANCPSCEEKVEWEMDIHDFKLAETSELLKNEIRQFSQSEYVLDYRLPCTGDMLELPGPKEDPSRWLLTRCIIEVKKKEKPVDPAELPDEILSSLSDRISREDELADIRMSLTCPACSKQWDALFDIVQYLWSEVDAWAKELLQDIAVLASSFGWSERQILELSPGRREIYLELIGT
jgi:hypothetical protein